MNADITVSGLAFKLIYSDKDGSLRREISRGVSEPTEITIQHRAYLDTRTKVPSKSTTVRVDYYVTMTDGVVRPVSLQTVLRHPDDVIVTAGIITAIEAMLVNLLHGTTNTSGLDLEGEIFSNGEQ